MKKSIVSAIAVFLLVSSVVTAQNRGIVQPKHPHKVYVDNQNAKIFIWKTGVYLYFSTEEGSATKRYQLINRNSAGQDTVSPFYLDDEGLNTIIEPNPKNRKLGKDKNSEFLLYADWSAPKTAISTNVNEHIVLDSREIRGSAFDVILNAREKNNGSGVSEVYISQNDGEFTLYDSVLPVTNEGLYTIRYYAVDNVGNVEKMSTKLYGLDLMPPISNHNVMSGDIGDILSPRAMISLGSRDNMAGVKMTRFFFDENNSALYERPISTQFLAEGNHVLNYYSSDKVKNEEAIVQYNFYLDRTPPVTYLSIEGDQYENGGSTYVSDRSRIVLNATDNKVEVRNIFYTVNGSNSEVYLSPLALVTSQINHVITYRAEDTLLNMAKFEKMDFILDIEKPVTLHSFVGENFQSRGIDYINPKTTVIIKYSDNLSGVQKIIYSINGDAEMEGNRFNQSEHGAYAMAYYALDNVNNSSETKSADIFVDANKPSVSYEFGVKNIDGETTVVKTDQAANQNTEAHSFPEKVVLFLYGSDDDSGVRQINYIVNGGVEQVYSNPLELSTPGNYSVDVMVMDNVGNTKEETISFTVEG